MIKKNIPSFAVVSIIYMFSDIEKEKVIDIYKFILSMNLKKIDFVYLATSMIVFFIAMIGCREILKSIIQRIEARREVMIKMFKKRLEKKYKEKK